MGFVTLNVLLYIVKIQGLGMLLFRIVNHRDGDIAKYVFNSALVHIFLVIYVFHSYSKSSTTSANVGAESMARQNERVW